MNLEFPNHNFTKEVISDVENSIEKPQKETLFEKLKNKAESIIENTQPYFQDTFRKGEQYIKIALFSVGAFAAQESQAQDIENANSLKDHIIEQTEVKYDSIMEKIDKDTYQFPSNFQGNELAFMKRTKEVKDNLDHVHAFKVNVPESEIEKGLTFKNLAMRYNHRMSEFDNTEKISTETNLITDSSDHLQDFIYDVEVLQSTEDNITPIETIRSYTSSGETKQEALLHVMTEMQNQVEVLSFSSAKTESINENKQSSSSDNYLTVIRVQSLDYYDSVEITNIENNGGEVYVNGQPEIQDGYTVTIKVNYGELQE